MTGIVFDIQRYSIHDGPGIRTLVFMKGCPLSCHWCCNPEGQKYHPEIRFIASKCVGEEKCNAPCVAACPNSAITLYQGRPKTDRELCQNCGTCAEACLYEARQLSGRKVTVEELLEEVKKDEPFYLSSGGGVTLGGGEPLVQFEFAKEFLKRCKEHHLHTAIETCGYAPWANLEQILEYVDVIYYDIKHMDPVKHRELTGVSNDLILENAKQLLATKKNQVIIRVPIIPDDNDSEKNIKATAMFVIEAGGKRMELLPYHRFGVGKYDQLDRKYVIRGKEQPAEEHMNQLRAIVESLGLEEVSRHA